MTFLKSALVACAMMLQPALADELPDDLRVALTAEVANFGQRFNDGDMIGVFDYMPDKVVKYLSAQAGLSETDLFAKMNVEIEKAMEEVTIDDFSMDMDTATWSLTPDGSTGYALIPTVTEMTVEGLGKVHATGETLAFQEGGDWYLGRVSDATQAHLLIAAYPAFEGVAFTPGTMEVMDE
jgi:hypothetical protein